MTKKRITSQHVAERAGVSRTTVSLVLNNVASANISAETRRRVLKAARDLNYVPDVLARALASGRSNNIGLILFHPHTHVFVNTYIPSVIAGLTQVAQQHGFRILIEIIEDIHAEDAYVRLMRGREIAGMVLSNPRADDAEITTMAENGFPIVSLDYLNDTVCSVSADDLGGVRKSVAHLARLGHKRIACITYAPIKANNQVAQRLGAFRDALEDFGLVYDERLVRFGDRDPETSYAMMNALLEDGGPMPSALFAMNDDMAIGAMKAIKEHGLRIPDDIAVVGYDDLHLSDFTDPPLTTVNRQFIKHGRLAGQLLIDLINNNPPPQCQVIIETTLVVRESCGAHHRAVSS